jgi:hypothetical protein
MSDAETDRMKAAHAARMAMPTTNPPPEQKTGVRRKVDDPQKRETMPDRSVPPPPPSDPRPGISIPIPEELAKEIDAGRVIVTGYGGGGGGAGGSTNGHSNGHLNGHALHASIDQLVNKMSPENVRGLITQECRSLEAMLHEKNRKYGNSALEPKRVFSKASPIEQIKVRIDDKISRLNTIGFDMAGDDEDTVEDLLGYLILLRVAKRLGIK